jgi:anti-sigma B factor antagonist
VPGVRASIVPDSAGREVSWARAAPPEFALEVERGPNGVVVVAVVGDVDLHSAAAFGEGLDATITGGAASVVVDLSGATFLDSQGLGVLVRTARRLDPAEGRFRLVVAAPQIRRVFEVSSLDRIFPLDGTREEALARIPPDRPRAT